MRLSFLRCYAMKNSGPPRRKVGRSSEEFMWGGADSVLGEPRGDWLCWLVRCMFTTITTTFNPLLHVSSAYSLWGSYSSYEFARSKYFPQERGNLLLCRRADYPKDRRKEGFQNGPKDGLKSDGDLVYLSRVRKLISWEFSDPVTFITKSS